MRAEPLWSCLNVATWKEFPEPINWEKAVRMIQAAFREVHLTEECTRQTAILTPKGNGNFRGIGLMEVLWKTVTEILNCLLRTVIHFHNTPTAFTWA